MDDLSTHSYDMMTPPHGTAFYITGHLRGAVTWSFKGFLVVRLNNQCWTNIRIAAGLRRDDDHDIFVRNRNTVYILQSHPYAMSYGWAMKSSVLESCSAYVTRTKSSVCDNNSMSMSCGLVTMSSMWHRYSIFISHGQVRASFVGDSNIIYAMQMS